MAPNNTKRDVQLAISAVDNSRNTLQAVQQNLSRLRAEALLTAEAFAEGVATSGELNEQLKAFDKNTGSASSLAGKITTYANALDQAEKKVSALAKAQAKLEDVRAKGGSTPTDKQTEAIKTQTDRVNTAQGAVIKANDRAKVLGDQLKDLGVDTGNLQAAQEALVSLASESATLALQTNDMIAGFEKQMRVSKQAAAVLKEQEAAAKALDDELTRSVAEYEAEEKAIVAATKARLADQEAREKAYQRFQRGNDINAVFGQNGALDQQEAAAKLSGQQHEITLQQIEEEAAARKKASDQLLAEQDQRDQARKRFNRGNDLNSVFGVGGDLDQQQAQIKLLQQERDKVVAAIDKRQAAEQAAADRAQAQAQARADRAQQALIDAAAKKAERDIEKQNQLNAALEQYIALADAAAARAKGYTSAGGPALQRSNVVQQTIDPAAAERATLPGAATQIQGIATGLEVTGKTPGAAPDTSARYQTDAANLRASAAQLQSTEALINSYKEQKIAATAAQAEQDRLRDSLRLLQTAMATTTTYDEKMAEAVKQTTTEHKQATAANAQEQEALTKLAERLKTVGVDTKDLATAEKTLAQSSAVAAVAAGKLQERLKSTGGLGGEKNFFGFRPYELTNFGYQINDVFTSLLSGISLFQTAAQQGGQIIQIAPVWNFLKSYFFIITPLIAAATVAIAAFMHAAAENQAIRQYSAILAASSESAQGTAKSYYQAQDALEKLGASSKDAEAAVTTFLRAGLNPQQVISFGKAAYDLSKVFGIDLPQAAQEVSTAFTGSLNSLDDLDKKYNFLTAAQREHIQVLFDEGKGYQALQEAEGIFAQKMQDGADKAQGPWSQAARSLKGAWKEFLDYLASDSFTVGLENAIAAISARVKELADLLYGIKKFTAEQAASGLPAAQAALDAANKRVEADKNRTNPTDQVVDALPSFIRGALSATPVGILGSMASDERMQNDLAIQADLTKRVAAMQAAIAGTTAQTAANSKATTEQLQEQSKQVDGIARKQAQRLAEKKDDQIDLQNLTPAEQKAYIARQGAAARQKAMDEFNAEGTVNPDNTAAIAKRDASVAAAVADATDDATQKVKRANDAKAKSAKEAAEKAANAAREEANAQQGLATELASINAEINKNSTTSLNDRLKAVDETYQKYYQKVDEYERKYGKKLANGLTTDDLRSQIGTAQQKARQDAGYGFFTSVTDDDVKQRTDLYKGLNDEVSSGAKDATAAYNEAISKTDKLDANLRSVTAQALAYAQAIKAAGKGSPENDAFISKMQLLQQQAGTGAGGAVSKEADALDASALTQINDLVKQRTDLVAVENDLAKTGSITETEAQAKIKAAYNETTPAILEQVQKLQQLLDLQLKAGVISQTDYDTQTAKLKLLQAQTQNVDANTAELQKTIENGFSEDLTQGFESVASSIGRVIDKQESVKDGFKDMEDAALNFFADFLKQIAEAILKIEALNAAQSLFGTSSGTSGGLAGGIGSLLGWGGGSSNPVTTITDNGQIGAGTLGVLNSAENTASSGSWLSGIGSWLGSLFHTGGIVGQGVRTGRSVDPSMFAQAPRFHSGGMVGLAPDEQATILQKGEEVLSKSSPRNARNGGAGSSSAPAPQIKQVLALTPDQIHQAMATAGGAQVIVSHIRANAGAVRQAIGVRKTSG